MPKKQKYRLEPLLKTKERFKRQAEMALARAMKELKEEQDKLKDLELIKKNLIAQREGYRAKMKEKVATGQSHIAETQHHLVYMDKLKADEEEIDGEIKRQKEVIDEAEAKLKRAKRDYIDAATELNVMEKHKELWLKKQAQELNALENKQMNELGNTVFQLRGSR